MDKSDENRNGEQMKVAVISDVHANLEAFGAVLSDIEKQVVDGIISLGDNVGYGPDPEAAVSLLRERGIPSVQGNHDRAVGSPTRHLNWFNPIAKTSLMKTIEMIRPETRAFLRDLPPFLVRHGARFVHGYPPNSSSTYLFQVKEVNLIRTLAMMEETMETPICFVGHTHELSRVCLDDGDVLYEPISDPLIQLDDHRAYIINAGSVGQPRDGNNKAKYLIWETEEHSIRVRYIAYDIERVVQKINDAGLPRIHGERLR